MARGSRNRPLQSAKFGSDGAKIPMHVLPSAKETFGPTPGRVRNHRSQALLCRLHNSRLLDPMRILHDCEEAANPRVGGKPSTPFGVRPRIIRQGDEAANPRVGGKPSTPFGVLPRIIRQREEAANPRFDGKPPTPFGVPPRIIRQSYTELHPMFRTILRCTATTQPPCMRWLPQRVTT